MKSINLGAKLRTFIPSLGLACLLPVFQSALAQPIAPGATITSVGVTGLSQFDTGLGSGGSFNWQDASANLNVTRQFTNQLAAGVNVRYGYQNWKWTSPTAFNGRGPWSSIETPALGMNFSYALTPEWRLGFAPTVEWSGESGTGTGGTATYGAVVSAARRFSKDLTLGLGAGVFRQIDQTKVFPYLIVNWNITDKLRLSNPLPAGPSGGAGLELSYALTEKWTLAGGGAYRSYRFRLNDTGPVPGGIGQNKFVPLFGRLSYQLAPSTRVDLYAAATVGGNLSVVDASGNTPYSDSYKTGAAAALSLSHRF
ncbi:MAG: DUF6268 family outer membrane beta-barrel protein [Betaproteobacteria bacterium]